MTEFRLGATNIDQRLSKGPLFHRWIPQGEEDAVSLDTGHTDYSLKVWFERKDFATGLGEEQAPISDYGALDAGPLKGKLEIENLSNNYVRAIRESEIDTTTTLEVHRSSESTEKEEAGPTKEEETSEEEYFELGKKLYKNFLYPCITRFINVLRIDYGQYWIQEMPEWDSREMTLGHYYQNQLFAHWSLDGGESWNYFCPNEARAIINSTFNEEEYQKFITKEDWESIPDKANQREGDGYKTTGEELLIETHQLTDTGKYKLAFIRGVTLLEVVTEKRVKPRLEKYSSEIEASLSVREIKSNLGGLQYLVAIIATPLENTTKSKIEKALRAIDTRNKIVHKDRSVPNDSESKEQLSALLDVAKSIMSREKIKLPQYLKPGSFAQSEWEYET